jgi:hypothetical protein
MDGLLEFAFDEINSSNLKRGIITLIEKLENIINVSDSENESVTPEDIFFNEEYWCDFLNRKKGSAIFINVFYLKINDKKIKNASIQIIGYENKMDLIILLSSRDCLAVDVNFSVEFFDWAKSLAVLFGASLFYGGLEPASDEKTQLYNQAGVREIFKL